VTAPFAKGDRVLIGGIVYPVKDCYPTARGMQLVVEDDKTVAGITLYAVDGGLWETPAGQAVERYNEPVVEQEQGELGL